MSGLRKGNWLESDISTSPINGCRIQGSKDVLLEEINASGETNRVLRSEI